MAAPTISWSTAEVVSSPGGGDVPRTYGATIGGGSKGAYLMITGAAGGDVGAPTSTPTLGGLPFALVEDTGAAVRRSFLYFLDDLTGRANDTISVPLETGPTWYVVGVGILDHTADLIVLDSDQADPADGRVTLDSGIVDAIALFCSSGGGSNLIPESGQTALWATSFVTLYDSSGGWEDILGSHVVGYTSGSSAYTIAAAIGGVDVTWPFSTRLEVEVGLTTGFAMEVASDIVWQPTRLWLEVGFRTGFQMLAQGSRQVLLADVDGFVETTETTEGGTEGQVLTYHEAEKPTWEDAAGGVTDHGALTGLADDDHPQYLTEDEADALYEPLGGGGPGGIPAGLLVYLYESFR